MVPGYTPVSSIGPIPAPSDAPFPPRYRFQAPMNRLRTLLVPLVLLWLASGCSSFTAFLYQGRLEHGPRESNGRQTGTWKYWFDADHLKLRAIGDFESDKPVGRWEFFHENGTKRWEVSFRNEAYDGPSTAWWPNGSVRSKGSFEGGLETGPWTFWNESGVKSAEGSFVRGARDGEWVHLASDGAVSATYVFERGTVLSSSATARAETPGTSAESAPSQSAAATTIAPPAAPSIGVVAPPYSKTQTGEGQADPGLANRLDGYSIAQLTEIYTTGKASAASGGAYPEGDPRNPPSQPKRDDARSAPFEGMQLPWTRLVQADGKTLDLAAYRGKSKVLLVILRGLKGRVCEYCTAQTQALQGSADKFRALNCEIVIVYPGPSERLDQFVSAAREYYQVHYGSPQPATSCKLTCDDGFQLVDKLDLRGDLARPAAFLIDEQSMIRYSWISRDKQDRPSCDMLLTALKGL